MTTSIFKPNKYSIDNGDIITVHITNINSNITLQRIFEEFLFLKFGDIIQIVLKGYSDETRKSEAYIDFNYFDKRLLEQLELVCEPVEFFQLDKDPEGDGWRIQKKKPLTHFYIEKNQKGTNQVNLIIQSISSSKTVHDIQFLFRELGVVEQVDLIWSKDRDCSLAVRGQSYVYFKEWGDEIYTYKFLDELKNKGVVTIKYNYEGEKDFLWVYKLYPVVENTIDYGYEFGNYYNWKPQDETENRLLKNNNLSWLFTTAGKFAYSKKIAEEELLPHGGLFIETGIGIDKTLFEIEIVEKPHPFDVIRKILKTSNEGVYGNYGTFEDGELYINEAEADDEEIQQMIIRVIKKKLKVVNKQDTMFFTSISNNELN